MRYFFLIFMFWSIQIDAQADISAVVLDNETNQPLEFVDVFNDKNYTSTNSEGKFSFRTSGDSIHFNRLGYLPKSFSISGFKIDTLHLMIVSERLREVHLLDKGIYKKMIDRLDDNYPVTPYNEYFFLRAIVEKDGHITKLADVNGKLERKRLFADLEKDERLKNNYTLEIANLRKAEIREDDIEFVFPSFESYFDLSSLILILSDTTNFELSNYGDHLVKLMVRKNESEAYLIINTLTYAFEESYIKMSSLDSEFKKAKGTESRDKYNIFHSFYKQDASGKYVLYKNLHEAAIECKYEGKVFMYVQRIEYVSRNHFSDFSIKSNLRATKDIFDAGVKYKNEFWNTQNQLLLTKDMQSFLDKVKAGDSNFKIKSNF